MLDTKSKRGTKAECDAFPEEVKAMGYTVYSYTINPINADKDEWEVTVTYVDSTEDDWFKHY